MRQLLALIRREAFWTWPADEQRPGVSGWRERVWADAEAKTRKPRNK